MVTIRGYQRRRRPILSLPAPDVIDSKFGGVRGTTSPRRCVSFRCSLFGGYYRPQFFFPRRVFFLTIQCFNLILECRSRLGSIESSPFLRVCSDKPYRVANLSRRPWKKFGRNKTMDTPVYYSLAGNDDDDEYVDRDYGYEDDYDNGDDFAVFGYSADGSLACRGQFSGEIFVWETVTGECVSSIDGHEAWVTAVAFSSNSELIVSGSTDTTVRVWAVATGACVRVLAGHSEAVSSVIFSPNGLRIVSGSEDGTLRVWNAFSGVCMRILQGHTGNISALGISNDGVWLASGCVDGKTLLWEIVTGASKALETHTGSVTAVTFSSDGRWVASGSENGTVQLFERASGIKAFRIEARHTFGIASVAFSETGDKMVTCGGEGTVRAWDLLTGNLLYKRSSIDDAFPLSNSADGAKFEASKLWGKLSLRNVSDAASHKKTQRSLLVNRCETQMALSTSDVLALGLARFEPGTGRLIADTSGLFHYFKGRLSKKTVKVCGQAYITQNFESAAGLLLFASDGILQQITRGLPKDTILEFGFEGEGKLSPLKGGARKTSDATHILWQKVDLLRGQLAQNIQGAVHGLTHTETLNLMDETRHMFFNEETFKKAYATHLASASATNTLSKATFWFAPRHVELDQLQAYRLNHVGGVGLGVDTDLLLTMDPLGAPKASVRLCGGEVFVTQSGPWEAAAFSTPAAETAVKLDKCRARLAKFTSAHAQHQANLVAGQQV